MSLRFARKGWGECTVCSSVKIPEAVLLSLAPNQGRFFTESAIVSSVKISVHVCKRFFAMLFL